jgi:hypothetical protein
MPAGSLQLLGVDAELRRQLVHQRIKIRIRLLPRWILIMPGNDLRRRLLEGDRWDVIRHHVTQFGIIEDHRVGAVSEEGGPPVRISSRDGVGRHVDDLRLDARGRGQDIVISFQVSTSSEVMWKASPIVLVLPSSGTKPLAKSSLCVSVHSEVPSPCTTTFFSWRMRWIRVQPVPGHRGAVIGVGRPDDHCRKAFLAIGMDQPILTSDLVS